ncbi:MAG: sensor histidine kinase, partial [Bryobacteraceae bacterium]
MGDSRRRPWLSWVSMSVLALLCGVLAVLQYRWIGEITEGERAKLREALNSRLGALSRHFNHDAGDAWYALIPPAAEVERRGVQRAYEARYERWQTTHPRIFHRIALAISDSTGLRLLLLNANAGRFAPAKWPAEWIGTRDRLQSGPAGDAPGAEHREPDTLFTFPQFGPRPHPDPDAEQPDREPRPLDWLLVEFDANYLRGILLPQLLSEYLGEGYEARVVENADPSEVLYDSTDGRTADWRADASAALLDIPPRGFGGVGGPAAAAANGPLPPGAGQGRWRLQVRHRAGSLDVLVARTRRRNLAISAALLLLILVTVAALVRFSRQAQRLAGLQIEFVAGVSHELRTPVTVIRTAAFNLRGRLASRPDQVERYGALIQAESEKLTLLVERVLRFASARAGYVIREREPVPVDALIRDGLRSACAGLDDAGMVDKQIDPELPAVLADRVALQQVFQNLMDNALKYGTADGAGIGVSASAVEDGKGKAVEIRVTDHGPGIPAEERERIFDPFFRGRRAVRDQVHGTGLGLNLVKTIVEAHG